MWKTWKFCNLHRRVLIKKNTIDYIQGVSEIRVLILTNGRTRQFMKLFSITFCKIPNEPIF
jgi:hypothetical protein